MSLGGICTILVTVFFLFLFLFLKKELKHERIFPKIKNPLLITIVHSLSSLGQY